MKIAVLNGSPKGDLSITMQYIRFIEKKNPGHEFTYINVAQEIKKIEKDRSRFREIIDVVKSSDSIIWGFPLYVMLVPSQYKRFIELIWERRAAKAFRGKYTATISTSIHFFDQTAHNYMRAICDDLEMKFTGSYSPDMYDIMKDEERERLLGFAGEIFSCIEDGISVGRAYPPVTDSEFIYSPGKVRQRADAGGKNVLILHDGPGKGSNLAGMVETLSESFMGDVDVADINDIDIKGGCLGCCQCGFDYRCVYTGKDGFIDFFNTRVKTADIIIMAGSIRDRYLSAKWKEFFDRCFFNTHTPVLVNKQLGFLVSGPLGQVANLREVLEAYAQFQQANLVDIVTDESADSRVLDRLIGGFASRLVYMSGRGYVKPNNFLGVGGMKIFRDDVYGKLRFVFQADHKYYQKHGLYDFPQKNKTAREMNKKMMALTKNPEIRENIRKMIKSEMVKPIKHIVDTR